MKTIINNLFPLIAIVFVILFIEKTCNPEITDTIIITDTLRETIYKDSIQYVSKTETEYIITSNLVEFRDTVYIIKEVVKEYMSKIHYLDTIKFDSLVKIVISDTIFQNKILNRVSDIEIYQKRPVKSSNLSAYVGLFYLSGVNQSIGVNLALERKKSLFSIGLSNDKTFLFNYSHQIFKK